MARAGFAASAVLYAVVVLVGARLLPDRVPMHFGADGAADRFGTRTELLIAETAVGMGIAVLFGLLAMMMHRVPLTAINVPHPEHWKTPEREGELRRRLATDVLRLGTATMLLLAAAAALTTRAAAGGADRLDPAAGVLVGVFVLVVLGWCVRMAVVGYRPPAEVSRRS